MNLVVVVVYWHRCNLNKDRLPVGIPAPGYPNDCKKYLRITNLPEMKYLHFVRDAVYAFAHALDALQKDACPGEVGVCERMRNSDGSVLKQYLERVNFEGNRSIITAFETGS